MELEPIIYYSMKKLIIILFSLLSCFPVYSQSKSELLRTNKSLNDSIVALTLSLSSKDQIIAQKDNEINMLRSKINDVLSILSTIPGVEAVPVNNVISQGNKDTMAFRQCKAITKKGTRCTRQAAPGSDYCWQHKGNSSDNSIYQSNSEKTSSSQSSPSSASSSKNGTTSSGYQIYTGPRGGKYYINGSGKKVYVRR